MKRYAGTTSVVRLFLIITAAVMALVPVSCGGGGGDGGGGGGTSTVLLVTCPASGTTDVSIADLLFDPADIQVPVDTVVKWTNNGPSIHTVTSTTVPANGNFNSGNMGQGDTICFQFTQAGTYNYHCSIHPVQMTGTVTVQ